MCLLWERRQNASKYKYYIDPLRDVCMFHLVFYINCLSVFKFIIPGSFMLIFFYIEFQEVFRHWKWCRNITRTGEIKHNLFWITKNMYLYCVFYSCYDFGILLFCTFTVIFNYLYLCAFHLILFIYNT